MDKDRLPPIQKKTITEFKTKVHQAYPGVIGAYGRETIKAIENHTKKLDSKIQKKLKKSQ